MKVEIYGRLVTYDIASEKLVMGIEFKNKILKQLLKGVKEGVIQNSYKKVVCEWKTNTLINI